MSSLFTCLGRMIILRLLKLILYHSGSCFGRCLTPVGFEQTREMEKKVTSRSESHDGSTRPVKPLSQAKMELEQARSTIQYLGTVRESLNEQIDQLKTELEQHPTSTSANMERRDREIERLKQVIDRMTESIMLSQKSILREIPERDQRISELEFQVEQLNSSLALRLARRIPFGSSIRKLLLFLGM